MRSRDYSNIANITHGERYFPWSEKYRLYSGSPFLVNEVGLFPLLSRQDTPPVQFGDSQYPLNNQGPSEHQASDFK